MLRKQKSIKSIKSQTKLQKQFTVALKQLRALLFHVLHVHVRHFQRPQNKTGL